MYTIKTVAIAIIVQMDTSGFLQSLFFSFMYSFLLPDCPFDFALTVESKKENNKWFSENKFYQNCMF